VTMKAYIKLNGDKIYAVSKVPFEGAIEVDLTDDDVFVELFDNPSSYTLDNGLISKITYDEGSTEVNS